jgi:hypothetical protein
VSPTTEPDQQKTDCRSEQRMFDEDCHHPKDPIHQDRSRWSGIGAEIEIRESDLSDGDERGTVGLKTEARVVVRRRGNAGLTSYLLNFEATPAFL